MSHTTYTITTTTLSGLYTPTHTHTVTVTDMLTGESHGCLYFLLSACTLLVTTIHGIKKPLSFNITSHTIFIPLLLCVAVYVCVGGGGGGGGDSCIEGARI